MLTVSRLRAAIFFIVFAAIIVLPWYLNVLILLALVIYFPSYPEAIFFGLMFDLLYSDKRTFFPTGLLIAAVVFFIVSFAKTRIRT